MNQTVIKNEMFGTLLGRAPGEVPAYSSDYNNIDQKEYPRRHSFHSYLDGIYMGYKWQCVEFARRWLYLNKGLVFDNVAIAEDIFELKHFRKVSDGELVPVFSFKSGSTRWPETGGLLIWEQEGEFEDTGHVAIVTEVSKSYIRIAEQNLTHTEWPKGQNYSRELKAQVDEDGGYWIESQFAGASIKGWVLQTTDSEGSEVHHGPDFRLMQLKMGRLSLREKPKKWLNIANADEAAFVKAMQGHKLTDIESDQTKFLYLSESARNEIEHATEELHQMFMHATDYVIENDELYKKFCFPQELWPRIKKSWDNRRNEMITGRMDFSLSPRGLKVYEYNSDSASCHMECGKVQGLWSRSHNCREGLCAGENLTQRLIRAWQEAEVEGVLHIMLDDNPEETYHGLYMKLAAEAAGLKCKLLRGLNGVIKNNRGKITDLDGDEVKWVWKTWAWETALDQLRDSVDSQKDGKINLADVLLTPDVMVYEPLWTLIPSNKAILPILWQLYPNHPYLLESQFDLTESLTSKGYVAKPIVGRCGENIQLYNRNNVLEYSTEGQFAQRDFIYQELCRLPLIGDNFIQMNSFTVAGRFSGACVRVDKSPVITSESDILPLRVINNEKHLTL